MMPAFERTLFLVAHSMMSRNWLQAVVELVSFALEPLQLAATAFHLAHFHFEAAEFPVAHGLQQVALTAATVFQGHAYEDSRSDLYVAIAFVAVVLATLAYVGGRLTWTSSSPNKALAFLRLIVLFLLTYLFMPTQEALGKFLLPYHAPDGA